MSSYTVNYIVYTPGHRHHHAGTQTQIIPQASGQSSQGEHFPVPAFSSLPFNNNTIPFAFMSVVGNADDNHLYTAPGTKDITTGTGDIKVTVVYAPAGGGDGHGGPGIWVDAFNVDAGDFTDSDFMKVFTNNALDNAKTLTANNDGIVSSATAEDMRANPTVDGLPFLQWEKIGDAVSTNADYMLAKNEGGLAFAFYQSKKGTSLPPRLGATVHIEAGAVYVSPGVLVDGGGFWIGADGKPHPVGPWGPYLKSLLNMTIASTKTLAVGGINKQSGIARVEVELESFKKSIATIDVKKMQEMIGR